MRKTKIICTIGPASDTSEILTELIKSGMSASRHNFSHGDHQEHEVRMNLVRELSRELNKPIAVLLDTKGPEIRTGKFAEGKVELKEGSEFTVYSGEEVVGDVTQCSVSYTDLAKDVKPGNMILIDDGLVGLEVKSIDGNKIHCIVKNTGMVGTFKGVNVPGVSINLPAITEKDIADLKFGVKMGVDFIAASFIRKASDVQEIRKVLKENGGENIQIFSKIENQEGVDNIDEIIECSDGIMVARGDLGVEIPIEQLPLVQKLIIDKCNYAGKSVITATQMLDSMIRNPRPTRAEASDIANAIFDGTDCIMLSGETANGKYPVEAVQTMAKIAEAAEGQLNYEETLKKKRKNRITNVPNAISLSACNIASDLDAAAIVIITETGSTAKMVSKFRPKCPIMAVTPHHNIARSLALSSGVFPIVSEKATTSDEIVLSSVESTVTNGHVKNGDVVIVASGSNGYSAGTTNILKVHVVGETLTEKQ